jgi:hypothetical protein
MKLRRYHIGKPLDGVCKSDALWGTDKAGVDVPLIYFRRPKWITSDAAWNKIINSIVLKLSNGFEIK